MQRRKLVYDGIRKSLYEGPGPDTLIQHFKDEVRVAAQAKHGEISGKGVINNRISEFLMMRLLEMGIPTHFIRRLNMREQLIRAVEVIPLAVVVRNVVAGSLAQRLGLEEGLALERPLIEWHFKDNAHGDPMVSEEHILAFDWASPQEIEEMVTLSLRVNDMLSGIFAGIGVRLIDLRIEYGRFFKEDAQQIMVIDELSPDTLRLWDRATGQKFDLDLFRKDLGDVSAAYQEVARRLGILQEIAAGEATGPRLVK